MMMIVSIKRAIIRQLKDIAFKKNEKKVVNRAEEGWLIVTIGERLPET